MTMTDPIADMLTRLRNANQAYHDSAVMPSSKLKTHIAEILQQEGYIAGWRVDDTDKDGKLTPQELGAMLRAKGIAWSPKRIEALLCAFDEDGDGALDLAEFADGLEQLAAVAGVVLEEQQPSQPAVAAGVVAVGSRLDKNNYVEEMAAWARDP